MNTLNKGQELLLTIKRIGINGEGIGYYKRLAIFVKGALPNEECVVRITKVYDNYSEADLIRVKTHPNPNRINPICPYFNRCGGCDLLHCQYDYQLQLKKDIVVESFKKYYSKELNPKVFLDTIGMEDPFYYRNKTKLPTRFNGEKIVTGMYESDNNILVYVDNCVLEDKLVRSTVNEICKYLTKNQVICYHPKSKEGVLKHIVVRRSNLNDDLQVTLILNKMDKRTINIAKDLIGIKNIVSVYYSINDSDSAIENFGHSLTHLVGEKTITSALNNLKFNLLPDSFFQLNSYQTVKLYDLVKQYAKLDKDDKVVDAYCGVGTIGLWVADACIEVRGIDNNKENIINAKENVKLNNITNATFYTGDVLPKLEEFKKQGWTPDCLIIDPPRVGMDNRLINYLQKSNIPKIIYVSCNPSTLAKNCDHLSKYYHILKIQPVDMFPHTAHVECIVTLSLKH